MSFAVKLLPNLTAGFGLNEIASGFSITNATSSIWSRYNDTAVIDPIAKLLGVVIRTPPPWLDGVDFTRDCVVLRKDMKKVQKKDVMAGVKIETLEGLATFMVLVLRDVEPIGDIVGYLQDLISGHFQVASGTEIDHTTGRVIGRNGLDYSTRSVLRRFVSSIIDTDKKTPQHDQGNDWMSRLTSIVSSSAKNHGRATEPIHTYSAGAAMIALAATSNGACVRVECMLAGDRIEMIPRLEERNLGGNPLVLRLWLTKPPLEIANQMDIPVMGSSPVMGPPPDAVSSETRMLSIFGGDHEISQAVAGQLECGCKPEQVLAMWTKGVARGSHAKWHSSTHHDYGLVLKLSPATHSFQEEVASQIGPLADSYYTNSQRDNRQRLARTATQILHEVFRYSDYNGMDNIQFQSLMKFILVSLALGCMKSLTTQSESRLSFYAWTFNCTEAGANSITTFCENAIHTGISHKDVLWTAARIWGGSDDAHHGYIRVHGRVLGIACPQLTILSTALTDIKGFAKTGLEFGLFSLHEGSIPILPRDPISGFVLAGESPTQREIRKIVTSETPCAPETHEEIIFSFELHPQQGLLSYVFCAWYRGDVALELDVFTVLLNLFRPLEYDNIHSKRPTSKKLQSLRHLSYLDLLTLKDFKVENFIGVGRTGPQIEWAIAAAGCSLPHTALVIKNDADANQFYEDELHSLPSGTVVIMCCDNLPDMPQKYRPLGRRTDRPPYTPSSRQSSQVNEHSKVLIKRQASS